MPEINAQGTRVHVSAPKLLNSLVLTKDQAMANRTRWETFVDNYLSGFLTLFGIPNYEKVIDVTYQLFNPKEKSSKALGIKILKLAVLAKDDQFTDALRLKVDCPSQDGRCSITISLQGPKIVEPHSVTMDCDDDFNVQFFEQFFELDSVSREYRLKPDTDNIMHARNRVIAMDDVFSLLKISQDRKPVDGQSIDKAKVLWQSHSQYDHVVHLINDMLEPNGSKAFERNILELDALLPSDQPSHTEELNKQTAQEPQEQEATSNGNMLSIQAQRERFYAALRLEVKKENAVSVVKVFLYGLDDFPIAERRFIGEYTPHDRFFEKVPGSTSQYQLLPDDTPEKSHYRDLYIKSRDMNQVWRDSSTKNDLLETVNRPLSHNKEISAMCADRGRIDMFYPHQIKAVDKVIAAEKGRRVTTDSRVVTQESHRAMVRRYFSPDLSSYSPSFQRLYYQFDTLSDKERGDFEDYILGKEISLSKELLHVKEQWDALASDGQEHMKFYFKFLFDNKFWGTEEEFYRRFEALPLKEKAICLVPGHQGFMALVACGIENDWVYDSNKFRSLFHDDDFAFWTVISVDEPNETVVFDVTFDRCYVNRLNNEKTAVARAVNKATCTVTIPKGQTLDKATVYFDQNKLDFTLELLRKDGRASIDHRDVALVENKYPLADKLESQLHKRRFMEQVLSTQDEESTVI